MKIVFMGTPDFAVESLKSLYESNKNIIAVVTNPDKPKGRGMKMIETPVKEYAKLKNIKIFQPLKVRGNTEFIEEIRKLEPDLLCVVAYGKILPKEILDIPKYGAINVHGSILPKYRGAAPIQWAVLNGEKETGNTTMFMDEGMDTGDIIYQSNVTIGEEETTGELWNKLAIDGGKLLLKTINKIEEIVETDQIKEIEKRYNDVLSKIQEDTNGAEKIEKEIIDKGTLNERNNELQKEIKKQIGAKKQGDNFTLAPMLNKEMSYINWNEPAEKIHNLIRGLNPIMGAYSFYNGKKIKIWKAKVVEEKDLEGLQNAKPGTIVYVDKNTLIIKAKHQAISVIEIQAENSKRMQIKDFLNGNKFAVNDKLQ